MNSETTNNYNGEVTREKLIADFKTVVRDAEELLKATATDLGQKASTARQKIEESLHMAKDRLKSAESAFKDQGKQAVEATDAYVRDNPWKAISIAAGVGLALGVIISRR